MITLTLNVTPVAKGRPRMTKSGHTYTPEKTRTAEDELKWLIKEQVKEPLCLSGTPLIVSANFYLPRPKKSTEYPAKRPDIDNYLKLLFDACNGLVWPDDAQIVGLTATKSYGDPPRIEIGIALMEA